MIKKVEKGTKNDEKIIRLRMNISKMSDRKIRKDLKNLERIEIRFENIF